MPCLLGYTEGSFPKNVRIVNCFEHLLGNGCSLLAHPPTPGAPQNCFSDEQQMPLDPFFSRINILYAVYSTIPRGAWLLGSLPSCPAPDLFQLETIAPSE